MRTIAEWETLEGDEGLTPAEVKLIAAVRAGASCTIAMHVPNASLPENTVRASLLSLLINGGTPDCGIKAYGVFLRGAWISSVLNCGFARAQGQTTLTLCRFESTPIFAEADLNELALIDSHLPGLFAKGVRIRGSLILRGLESEGTVNLAGAKVQGQMELDGARLEGPVIRVTDGRRIISVRDRALAAQGIAIGSALILRYMHAKGRVDLSGAKVDGPVFCEEARFSGHVVDQKRGVAFFAQGMETAGGMILRGIKAKGTVDLNSATIGGTLDCDGAKFLGPIAEAEVGISFNAHRLQVRGSLLWRSVVARNGTLLFSAAHAADFEDDGKWPDGEDALFLDGFTYERLGTYAASVTPQQRKGWLKAGSSWKGSLSTRPYTQLARVYRAMGLDREARTILIDRESKVAQRDRLKLREAADGRHLLLLENPIRDLRFLAAYSWDLLTRLIVGYGFAPERSIYALAILVAIGGYVASRTWEEGQFAPNSDVILTSSGWQQALGDDCLPGEADAMLVPCIENPAKAWANDPARGLDWESFHPVSYAADVVVPVLDLGQESAWAPSKDRGSWGFTLWWLRWVLATLGWVLSLFGAAAITGIIQRDRE